MLQAWVPRRQDPWLSAALALPPLPAVGQTVPSCLLDTVPLFPDPCVAGMVGDFSDLRGYSWPGCICLLLCQSRILNNSLFLSSALFFLPLCLEILVVFSCSAETVRLLLDDQCSSGSLSLCLFLAHISVPGLVLRDSNEISTSTRTVALQLARPSQARLHLMHPLCMQPVSAHSTSAPGKEGAVRALPTRGLSQPFGPRNCWFAGHTGTSPSCAHRAARLGVVQPLQRCTSCSSSS